MTADLCVIGAGWAGFNAALAAAKQGKSVCLIEETQIGGTCLNRGCIPTKALITYAKRGLTYSEIVARKDAVVARLRQGMEYLLKTNKIDVIAGRALIKAPGLVSVAGKEIKARFILIAAGSTPRELPGTAFDHQKVVSSDDVLGWTELPKKILIVGGGVIGCEFACFFKKMGVEVTVVEALPQLIPGLDGQVSKKLEQAMAKQGIAVFVDKKAGEFNVNDFDKVLLAVGRRSVTEGLWEDGVGVKTERGGICVDRALRTHVSTIFAAGDCIGGYMLAHVASYEGELAVANMFGDSSSRDYAAIPSSVFTAPEVGAIGLSEEEARKFGAKYAVRTVTYLSIGMAHVLEDTQGFVKMLVEERSGRLLGAGAIGPQATELVNFFSLAMKNNIPISGLRKTIFAHPSISEIIAEAAKAFD